MDLPDWLFRWLPVDVREILFEEEDEIARRLMLSYQKKTSLMNPVLPARVNFEDLEVGWFQGRVRMSREGFLEVHALLGLPEQLELTSCKTTLDSKMALFLFLHRMADGCRYFVMATMYGYHTSVLSESWRVLLATLGAVAAEALTLKPLRAEKLETLVESVREMTGRGDFVAFIDGTAYAIARPGENQHLYYSGRTRKHEVRYQVVVTPDGIIREASPEFFGRAHDRSILRSTEYAERGLILKGRDGRQLYTYGDSGYRPEEGCVKASHRPYINRPVGPEQREDNARMATARIAIENIFSRLVNLWKILVMKFKLRLNCESEKIVHIAFFLTNVITCLERGNQISQRFNVYPPTAAEYISNDE